MHAGSSRCVSYLTLYVSDFLLSLRFSTVVKKVRFSPDDTGSVMSLTKICEFHWSISNHIACSISCITHFISMASPCDYDSQLA